MTHYFEDLSVGESFRAGSLTVTEPASIAFAERYVPLASHLRGETTPWLYAASLSFRLVVDEAFGRLAFVGGWGIDDLAIHREVRPGHSLSVELDVLGKRPRDRGRGDVDFEVRVYADDELALSYLDHVIVERRSGDS